MRFIKPDFYDNFECKAQNCKHSCCVGWEIDVDEESLIYYNSVEDEIGNELRENISDVPSPHFVLGAEERCPFLEKSGLCRLILTLGEDSLCDICREHPRFYNEFSDRTEAGLGLCCEEAARLLLSGEKNLDFICLDDGEEEFCDEEEEELLKLRDLIFSLLADESRPLYSCMESCAEICGTALPKLDMPLWAEFYLGLERLDEAWTEALYLLKNSGTEEAVRFPDGIKYRRLTEYFIYRHFASAGSREKAAAMLQFSVLSVAVIYALETLGMDCEEAVRLYSSEIEYSDENIELITDKIGENERN